jgi:hypothetical protein
MTLPSYVRYTGKATPGIAYDDATRTVTWNIGSLEAAAAGDAAFQVAITPSASQKGTSPALTSNISAKGFDRFVQKDVTASAAAVTIDTKGDPSYTQNSGTVH